MMGTAARAAPAMIRPKSVDISACSFAMPREIVSFVREFSIISCRK